MKKTEQKPRIALSAILPFCGAVLLFGCGTRPDEETLRLYMRAGEAYGSGNFTETVALLEKVKKFPPALTLRAKAQYFSGDFAGAELSCRQALKARPAAFEARYYLIRMLHEGGKTDEAAAAVEDLLADYPHDIRTLRLAAAICTERGKDAEAAGFLDKAAELSAEGALALLDRARLRWIAGRGPDALADLDRAAAMLPWDTPLMRSVKNLELRIREAL